MDMNPWHTKWHALSQDSGQDLLEYALLVALIAVVAIGAVSQVGTTINTVFWEAISSANVAGV